MSAALVDIVRHHAEVNLTRDVTSFTPIPGLTIIREMGPTALQYAVSKPLVALLLQGNKRVTLGSESLDFGAGESLVIAADIPTVSQITRASVAAPYFSIVFDLDAAIIEGLMVDMGSPAPAAAVTSSVHVDATEADVADTALRLLRLLDRPASLAVLHRQLFRELHFWLMSGRHGTAIRGLGVTNGHAQRIGRAVSIIRENYAKPLRLECLAEAAGMSISSFHEHFRAITSLTPLQFQKQMRLIEARRMMLADGATVSSAAYTVGYESVTQFTREYGRLFGMSPARDIRQAQDRMRSAA
ncbi:AraC family transcriptional regulator [Bradyrhizobium sp. dw_411]|uniref:AraC family transcriptional regulator n=1 Tax=Bradyrhizobium sp. dw_411 TaxID=2720082 RepID=UPI001BCB822C|nr:AraC family transcriptional regulator [Bradyrhizobium sp. dw_411]